MIIEERIIEIYNSYFKKENNTKEELEKLYWWIFTSIESWVSEGKYSSFSPFNTLFSLHDNGISIFSTIGNALPRQKMDNSVYSPYSYFIKSLISILDKKNLYIDNRKAWSFVLNVVREMKLDDSIPILGKLINLKQFRLIHRNDGYNLFEDAFNTVYSFGPNEKAKKFYDIAINYINDYSFLSFKLLERLLEIDPKNNYKYIENKYFIKAIRDYRMKLYKTRGINLNEPVTLIIIYAKKYSEILKRDEDYINFFKTCKFNYLDFILLDSRVKKLPKELKKDSQKVKNKNHIIKLPKSTREYTNEKRRA